MFMVFFQIVIPMIPMVLSFDDRPPTSMEQDTMKERKFNKTLIEKQIIYVITRFPNNV